MRAIVSPGALLLVFALAACGGKPGEVKGKVTFRDEGVAGVAVEVYLRGEKSGGGTPFMTAVTDAEGDFLVTLPPGRYFLWAKEDAPAFGPRKIAEYPLNPIVVPPGGEAILVPLELRPAGGGEELTAPAGAGVRGRTMTDGEALEDAVIMIYRGERTRLMGPGYAAVVRSDAEGLFQADLAPGEYRVAVRKRTDGAVAGFLGEGDLTAEFEGNPVRVRSGEYTDLGRIALHRVDRERLAAQAEHRFQAGSSTRLRGSVVDAEGKPMEGQFVFVYKDEGMIGRPEIVAVTAVDGSFTLDLPGGGKYYLGARSSIGGPRQPGEWVGRVAGSPDSSVEIEGGREMEGLTIPMEAVW